MNVLYPGFLWAAGALAAAVLGLHWLTTRQRQPEPFPTLRFVPRSDLQTTALTLRLSDRRLLLLRLLIVLLLGLAFAQPQWVRPGSVARVLLVDGSASVARSDAWRAQVLAAAAQANTVLVYGDTVQEMDVAALQAFMETPPAVPVGRLSPALLAALRDGDRLRERAQTVELEIIAPFLVAAFDAATPGIRGLWPTRIGLTSVPAQDLDAPRPANPVLPAVELHWAGSHAGAGQPLWQPRAQPDVQAGLYTPVATLVASFERRWQLVEPLPADVRAIAWWLDGEPAAVERVGAETRQTWLGFALPEAGDATLRAPFVRFLDWLQSPARAPFGMVAMAATELQAFAQAPPQPVLSAADLPSAPTRPLALWLLALALLLAALEPLLRRWLADRRNPASAPHSGEPSAPGGAQ